MSTRVLSDIAAQDVATNYITERYPDLEIGHVSVLKLESSWLAESLVFGDMDDNSVRRVLLMINRFGFVEEIGDEGVSRQSAHRCLADLRTGYQTIDLK